MFDAWDPSRYERIIYGNVRSKNLAAQLAGLSRSIRISHEPRTPEQSTVFNVACGVTAPLVFFYVWWLLYAAHKKGIRRIYFMARDGQIFMQAAHELISQWKLDIDVRYLYCSRESLLLPSYENTGNFELHWITWGYASSISISEICRRVGITIQEAHPFLVNNELGEYASNPDRSVERCDIRNLEKLLKDKVFEKLIREKSEPLFRVALSYLEQELLFDGVPSVLADTGWQGSSQYALSALMNKGGKRPSSGLTGFYLGLNHDVHLFDNDTIHSFLFDWRVTPRDYRLYYFICFEMLFSADHGRTLGYLVKEGAIIPVLGTLPEDHVRSIATVHHHKVVEFANVVAGKIPFDSFDDSFSEVSRIIARTFINSPTAEEAEVYGGWPIASEMCEGDFQEMAPPMSGVQFVRCALGMEKISGYWPQASLVRSSNHLLCYAYNQFLRSGVLGWYRRFVLRY